jgi:hypothetical protein
MITLIEPMIQNTMYTIWAEKCSLGLKYEQLYFSVLHLEMGTFISSYQKEFLCELDQHYKTKRYTA